jgi:hypothetical protein
MKSASARSRAAPACPSWSCGFYPGTDPGRQQSGTAETFDKARAGFIHIEKINAPFLCTLKANEPEFGAAVKYAIEQGSLEMHESGTYVRLLAARQ